MNRVICGYPIHLRIFSFSEGIYFDLPVYSSTSATFHHPGTALERATLETMGCLLQLCILCKIHAKKGHTLSVFLGDSTSKNIHPQGYSAPSTSGKKEYLRLSLGIAERGGRTRNLEIKSLTLYRLS